MSKDEPTNGELKIMLDNVKETAGRIEQSVDKITSSVQDSSAMMIKLSNSLENLNKIIDKHDKALFDEEKGVLPMMEQLKGAYKTMNSLKSMMKYIVPGLITILVTSFGLYIEKIKNEIIRVTAEQSEDISYKTTNKVFDERVEKLQASKK